MTGVVAIVGRTVLDVVGTAVVDTAVVGVFVVAGGVVVVAEPPEWEEPEHAVATSASAAAPMIRLLRFAR